MSTSAPRPAIVWFRRDLRLAENPALARAIASGRPIIPVFVLETSPAVRPIGAASRWWLDKSLRALEAELCSLGSRLILRRGDAGAVIQRLAAEAGAGAIFWNRLYDAPEIARDTQLKAVLRAEGVEVQSSNAALLNEPWEVKTGSGGDYQVFGAYWRAARARIGSVDYGPAPDQLIGPDAWPESDDLAVWRLHPRAPDWSGGFSDWSPGEAGAQAALERFLNTGLSGYGRTRDIPSREGVSRLSPHLHWGEIGPRQIWRAVQTRAYANPDIEPDAEKFLTELGWREFNCHLGFHRTGLATQDVRATFQGLVWRKDPEAFAAWSHGQTGYPIVDAGMRQLWATGWMHNRVRMIVASFLVKDLLIDWREGEAWFWDTLVDADSASNAGNWQWVAGCGADAAPFFRIFNPTLQGERFDPDGVYIRRWVPELRRLQNALVHKPWAATADQLTAAGLRLGQDYPPPIVDHGEARARALEVYHSLRP